MRRDFTPAARIAIAIILGAVHGCKSPDISLFDESGVAGLGGQSPQSTGGGGGTNAVQLRDPRKAPFSVESIWNMPLGQNAEFVPARIQPATDRAFTPAEVILAMTPNAPPTPLYFNGNGFILEADRCSRGGDLLGNVPLPDSFLIPNAPGSTPNNQGTFLLADGVTIAQTEPFYRCETGGIGTALVNLVEDSLRGPGLVGASGGSGMSSLGGTLRLGELRPGEDHVRHALRVHLNGSREMFDCAIDTECFRWPARRGDGQAVALYGGANSALRMGALLAIPSDVLIETLGLETDLGAELAWTFQNFGGYVVNDAGWSTVALGMERSPDGRFLDQVKADYAIDLDDVQYDTPFARDMDRLFSALAVVDDNSELSPGGRGPRITEGPGELEPTE